MSGIKKEYLDWLYAEKHGADNVAAEMKRNNETPSDSEQNARHANELAGIARKQAEYADNYIVKYLEIHGGAK